MKRMLAMLAALMLALGAACAEETPEAGMLPVPTEAAEEPLVTVEEQSLELMGSVVRAPQLRGMADAALEAAVNERIMTDGGFKAYFDRMALLMSDEAALTVTYDARLAGDVFSCVAEAYGAVVDLRTTHVWSAVNLDLTDGHAISWEELFTDPQQARSTIETYLEEVVAPELSAHLYAGQLTPLPEHFGLSPWGLTLLYPIEQYVTLADKAGAVTILWSELRELLDLHEGGVLDRIGAAENLSFPEDAAAALTEAFQEGAIPGVPAALGQSVQELADTYGLLIDPDLYEGGRMILLDHAAFRGVYLLTDALTETLDQSVVQGLRADRLNLLGLQTGITTREEYLAALGDPESTITVDEARAESWRIVPGISDYYILGVYRLRLHTDENGVLASVFITP